MRKAAFQELLMKESNILKRLFCQDIPEVPITTGTSNRLSAEIVALIQQKEQVLEAIEKVALEYPSYGVRRITAMLHRSGITANRKRLYRMMKIANLVRKRSVRRHVIIKSSRLSLGKLPVWRGLLPFSYNHIIPVS